MKHLLLLILVVFVGFALLAQSADSSLAMDTVRIRASRPAIENRVDKTVVYPGRLGTTAGQHLLDLLRGTPGVAVDAAENLLIGGRNGVMVYVDGQPTQLTGADLAAFLKSIEGDAVSSIEIIAQPGARYDAAGNAGIINIRMKKPATDGWRGNMNVSHAQSVHARQTGSVALQGKRDKFRFFLNGNVNNGLQHTVANNDRRLSSKIIEQRGIEKDRFGGNALRTGIDFTPGLHSVIGFIWSRNGRFTRMDNSNLALLRQPGVPDSSIFTRSLAPFEQARNGFNFNYNFQREGREWTLNADRTIFRSSVDNSLFARYAGGGQPYDTLSIRNNQDVRIRLYSFQADYRKTVKRWQWESGLKWLSTQTDNTLEVMQWEALNWKQDTGKTNRFLLSENIASAYGSMTYGDEKWSGQLGLRSEYTKLNGKSTDLRMQEMKEPRAAYLSLFPTLMLQWKRGGGNSFSLQASRRIDRPSYQDQNPFIYALDALNSEQGNPQLLPQFTSSVEIGYTYKWASSAKLRFARTEGLIEQLLYGNGEGTVLLPQNAGIREMINLSLSTPARFFSWWSAYFFAEPFWQSYAVQLNGFGSKESNKVSSFGLNGYVSQTFTLKQGWKLDCNGWYNFGNRKTIYQTRALGSVNFGVQKTGKGERWNARLVVTDIFNTQSWQQQTRTETVDLLTYRKWESRNLTLSFGWKFGSSKVKAARERETEGDRDSQRIK